MTISHTSTCSRRLCCASALAGFVLLISLLSVGASAAESATRMFDLPAVDAVVSLKLFAQQSGEEIVYAPDHVRGTRTNAVKGEFAPHTAVERMLAGTVLAASQTTSGLLLVKRTETPEIQRTAQSTPDAPPKQKQSQGPSSPMENRIIEMSPFEVSELSDRGYAARETVAGTRFKTELKDMPSQISVMTAEFIEDIATVEIEDAFRYSLNIENRNELQGYGSGDFNSGVVNVMEGNRVRGLRQPGRTHDFFQTFVPGNMYNSERITFSSGPNSILFGNGNPSGTVDTSFKRANVRRRLYSVMLRGDNHGSFRTSLDFNHPVLQDKVAVRLAAVKSNEVEWRAPAGEDAERIFGSITIKPFPSTVIRGWYEDASLDRISARNTRVGDGVTPWIQAGRPLFDNSLASPTGSPAADDPIFSRNTVRKNVYLFGASAADGLPLMQWGSEGHGTGSGQPVYSVVTKGPGAEPYQTGSDSYHYSLRDDSGFPNDISVNGTGTRNRIEAAIKGFTLEQRVGRNLFLEYSHNEETVVNPNIDLVRGAQMVLRADANRYLPDRMTPNPNAGQYYVEGIGRGRIQRRDVRENRAMASYELNLTDRNRWLGDHRLALMYQRVHDISGGQEFATRQVPAGTPFAEALELYGSTSQVPGGPTYNTLRYRAYLSDPATPSTGRTYYFDLPYVAFDPHTLADGSTVYTTNNPFGGTNAGQLSRSLLEGRVFALQNRFWDNRVVSTLGWRWDQVRAVSRPMDRLGGPDGAFESILDATLPADEWEYISGNTTTAGAVFHALPWISVFYNESNTWNAPRLNSHNPDNSTLPGSIGEGKDYGLMLRFLDNRISFRLNRFESTSGPDNSNFRNDILAPILAIERSLHDAAENGLIPAYQAAPGFHPNPPGTFYYEVTSDRVSRGYEAEFVGNPTPNWRIFFNAARIRATESNIGRVWLDFIHTRIGYWAQHGAVQDESATTVSSRVLNIIQTLNLMRQADGQSTEQTRGWRANLLTRYTFDHGSVRGLFIGGGFRWRSKPVIGYRAVQVPNEFEFPGAEREVVVPALSAPVYGGSYSDIEGFAGYTWHLYRGTLKVQFNVRNLLDDDDPIAQRANTAGDVTIFTDPEPRTFILSATFSY